MSLSLSSGARGGASSHPEATQYIPDDFGYMKCRTSSVSPRSGVNPAMIIPLERNTRVWHSSKMSLCLASFSSGSSSRAMTSGLPACHDLHPCWYDLKTMVEKPPVE